jgi:hypothetical protein
LQSEEKFHALQSQQPQALLGTLTGLLIEEEEMMLGSDGLQGPGNLVWELHTNLHQLLPGSRIEDVHDVDEERLAELLGISTL